MTTQMTHERDDTMTRNDTPMHLHDDNDNENEWGYDQYEDAFTGNRDVPPWDNDPRSDQQIKDDVYARMNDDNYDDDHDYTMSG